MKFVGRCIVERRDTTLASPELPSMSMTTELAALEDVADVAVLSGETAFPDGWPQKRTLRSRHGKQKPRLSGAFV